MTYSTRPCATPGRCPMRGALFGAALTVSLVPVGGLSAQTPECPDYDPELAIVWGTVRALEGSVPIPAATVVVRWSGGESAAGSLRDGLYIVCGVRPRVPVVVQATVEPFTGAGVPVELEPGEARDVPLAVAFGGTAAHAATGRVVGTVVDRQTLRPIPNALIGTDALGYAGVSDGAGRFRLDGVEPGRRSILVRHLAYGESETPLAMPSDGTLELEIRLDPAVLPVDPIEVRVLGVRSHKLEMSGFYARRDWNERLGLGSYVTRVDIEDRGAARVSHILAEIPRVDFVRGSCRSSRCDSPVIRATNPTCQHAKRDGIETILGASLYLDGRRVRQVAGQGVDDFVMPGDVAGIEVYNGTGDLPGEFADHNAQRCGAIVIWTGS